MYSIPNDLSEAIFGTGFTTTRGNLKMTSDVGFINQIWSIGIIGMLMLISFYITNTIRICKYYTNTKERHILVLGAIVVLLVSNIKGDAFSWNEITQLWFLIFTKYIYDLFKQKIKV